MKILIALLFTATAHGATAAYVKTDTATQGSWKGVYGGDGYAINYDATSYPSYTNVNPQITANGTGFTWTTSTTDVRALQKAFASDRIAAGWYSWTDQTIDVNITDQNTHQIALYCLDWDGGGARSERVDMLDAASNAVLDTRTITAFQNGAYLVWNVVGHVKLKITVTAGANGVISGIFFGAATAHGATAAYVKTDTATQGSWKGVYGGDGYAINYDATSYPSYTNVNPQITANGTGFTWTTSTTDVRALQKAFASDRIAAGWYSWTDQTIDVNITDQNTHQIALYCLDWDGGGARSERVDMLDAASNAVLDTRTIAAFQNGAYLVWNVVGHVKLKITVTAGANGVISGIFFGVPSTGQSDISFGNMVVQPGIPLIDDFSGTVVTSPTSVSPWAAVKLRNGQTVNVHRADNINVTRLEYAREPIGQNYAYHFTIDSRQVYMIRMGEVQDNGLAEGATQENPKGWAQMGGAWVELDKDIERAEDSVFSITSKWKPGLLPIYLAGEGMKILPPYSPKTDDNERIAAVASIFNNSVQKFVIGPAIPPDATQETLDALVQRWVEDYGFGFLRPVMEGKGLDAVTPSTDLERDALKCLQDATAALSRK